MILKCLGTTLVNGTCPKEVKIELWPHKDIWKENTPLGIAENNDYSVKATLKDRTQDFKFDIAAVVR